MQDRNITAGSLPEPPRLAGAASGSSCQDAYRNLDSQGHDQEIPVGCTMMKGSIIEIVKIK